MPGTDVIIIGAADAYLPGRPRPERRMRRLKAVEVEYGVLYVVVVKMIISIEIMRDLLNL